MHSDEKVKNTPESTPTSPFLSSIDWAHRKKLFSLIAMGCLGIMLNGSFISSFFLDAALQEPNKICICLLGICDLMITAVVIPLSMLLLISSVPNTSIYCNLVHMVFTTVNSAYDIISTFVSYENYRHLVRRVDQVDESGLSGNKGIGFILAYAFIASCLFSILGFTFHDENDYCKQLQTGNTALRILVFVCVTCCPLLLNICFMGLSILQIKKLTLRPNYQRSNLLRNEVSNILVNICIYAAFVLTWVPYLVIIYTTPIVTSNTMQMIVFISAARAALSSLAYVIVLKDFRDGFLRVYHYLCCKKILPRRFNRRVRAQQMSRNNIAMRGLNTVGRVAREVVVPTFDHYDTDYDEF